MFNYYFDFKKNNSQLIKIDSKGARSIFVRLYLKSTTHELPFKHNLEQLTNFMQ